MDDRVTPWCRPFGGWLLGGALFLSLPACQTEAPTSNPPPTAAPRPDGPATDAPATDAPATDAPATDTPATDTPATDTPATEGKAPATSANGSPAAPQPRSASSPKPVRPNVATPPATVAAPAPFEGWPQPEVVLVLTGQQLGYIEPCGCTGLENQKGGLARRHTLLKQLAGDRGWTVVPLDIGNQVRRFGKQSEIKFQRTAEALRLMGYKAAALGPEDLQMSPGELVVGTNPDDQPSLFIGANLAVLARDLQPAFTVVEAAGKRIGITTVLGKEHESKITSDELFHEPPLQALQQTAAELQAKKCDLYVLLANASPEEARLLAQQVPLFDLVVVPGRTPVPGRELESIPDVKTKLIALSTKSMYAGVVGVFADPRQPFRLESVALDAQLADSPEMLELFARYQQDLQSLGLQELGARPQPHPTGRKFVGSQKCGECHTQAFAQWSATPHARATESIVHPPNSRGEIARHFDPECLSCHVTGWHAQKFFPYETGYLDLQSTPALQHNGCENCHGPGSAHVAAESGEGNPSSEMIAKLRDAMKLPLGGGVAERKCLECHDDDNSPEFHQAGAFERYWSEVEHRGKD